MTIAVATQPDSATHALCHAALALPGLRHGWFTRQGGVSSGVYASLNAGPGSNDDAALVAQNRARIAASMGVAASHLLSPYQYHSSEVLAVSAPFAGERPKADALVTRTPGLALAILTADCGPILFADARNGVIGAAHAGWQGALGGVIENTIAAMEKLGAERGSITAVLGPTISQPNYEVGADFEAKAVARDAASAGFFAPGAVADKRWFDLPGCILMRLGRAGVEARWTGQCTYADAGRFFSFRRTTHAGEADYGRQASVIVLE
jgi:YfiH family protein